MMNEAMKDQKQAGLLSASGSVTAAAEAVVAGVQEATQALLAVGPRLAPVGKPVQDDDARIRRERVEALDALRDLVSWVRRSPGFVPDELRRAERVLMRCSASAVPGTARHVDTLHGVDYWLMDEGCDQNGAPKDGLYARPVGWTIQPVRVSAGVSAIRNLDKIAESRAELPNILRAHGVSVPAWAEA